MSDMTFHFCAEHGKNYEANESCPDCTNNLALSAIDAQAAVDEVVGRLRGTICYASTNAEWPNSILEEAADLLDRLAQENRELWEDRDFHKHISNVRLDDIKAAKTYNPETHVPVPRVPTEAILQSLRVNFPSSYDREIIKGWTDALAASEEG